MKDWLTADKENFKGYRNCRYKKQPLSSGQKWGEKEPPTHIHQGWEPVLVGGRGHGSQGGREVSVAHANLLSRVPGNVTCWRQWATKSLEGIAWEGDWQRTAAGHWLRSQVLEKLCVLWAPSTGGSSTEEMCGLQELGMMPESAGGEGKLLHPAIWQA